MPELEFKIRDLKFEVYEQANKEYAMKVTFVDGEYVWLSHEFGTCERPTACCYQAMLWMEKTGI